MNILGTTGRGVRINFLRWLLLMSFVIFWQWSGSSSDRARFFYSTPIAVFSRMLHELARGTIVMDAAVTCEEVLTGSAAGLLVGVFLALGLWWMSTLGQALEPIIIALASVPLFAVAPLLVFWFGVGFVGKLVVVGLSVVFVVLLSTYQAAKEIDEDYRELAQCSGISRSEVFRRLIFKGSLLQSIPQYRLAVVFGFIGAFLAEVISSNRGLGHFIQRNSGLYDVAGSLTGLAAFILCVLLFIVSLNWMNRYLEAWR